MPDSVAAAKAPPSTPAHREAGEFHPANGMMSGLQANNDTNGAAVKPAQVVEAQAEASQEVAEKLKGVWDEQDGGVHNSALGVVDDRAGVCVVENGNAAGHSAEPFMEMTGPLNHQTGAAKANQEGLEQQLPFTFMSAPAEANGERRYIVDLRSLCCGDLIGLLRAPLCASTMFQSVNKCLVPYSCPGLKCPFPHSQDTAQHYSILIYKTHLEKRTPRSDAW